MRRNTVAIQEMYVRAGRAIMRARVEARVTATDLANACGITQQHMQKIESAETACALHVLVAVADHLDLSLDELVPVETKARKSE